MTLMNVISISGSTLCGPLGPQDNLTDFVNRAMEKIKSDTMNIMVNVLDCDFHSSSGMDNICLLAKNAEKLEQQLKVEGFFISISLRFHSK